MISEKPHKGVAVGNGEQQSHWKSVTFNQYMLVDYKLYSKNIWYLSLMVEVEPQDVIETELPHLNSNVWNPFLHTLLVISL